MTKKPKVLFKLTPKEYKDYMDIDPAVPVQVMLEKAMAALSKVNAKNAQKRAKWWRKIEKKHKVKPQLVIRIVHATREVITEGERKVVA